MAPLVITAYNRSPGLSREFVEAIRAALDAKKVAAEAWCDCRGKGRSTRVAFVVDTELGRLVVLVDRRRQNLKRLLYPDAPVLMENFGVAWPIGELPEAVEVSCSRCEGRFSVERVKLAEARRRKGRPSAVPVVPVL